MENHLISKFPSSYGNTEEFGCQRPVSGQITKNKNKEQERLMQCDVGYIIKGMYV